MHLSFIASLAVYVVVVEWLTRQPGALEIEPAPDALLNSMRTAFGLIATISLGAAFVLVLRPGPLGQEHLTNLTSLLAYSAIELIAVLGLILFIMGGSRFDFYLFAFISIVGYFLMLTQANRRDRSTDIE